MKINHSKFILKYYWDTIDFFSEIDKILIFYILFVEDTTYLFKIFNAT